MEKIVQKLENLFICLYFKSSKVLWNPQTFWIAWPQFKYWWLVKYWFKISTSLLDIKFPQTSIHVYLSDFDTFINQFCFHSYCEWDTNWCIHCLQQNKSISRYHLINRICKYPIVEFFWYSSIPFVAGQIMRDNEGVLLIFQYFLK